MDPIFGTLMKLVLISISCAATLDVVLPYENESIKKKLVTALIWWIIVIAAWFTL